MTNKFPIYQGATFGRPEVESYLEEIASIGWHVYFERSDASYIVMVNEEKYINIYFWDGSKKWYIETWDQGECISEKRAINFQPFRELISTAMQSLGQLLDAGPKSIRLKQQSPLSNRVGLVNLAHGSYVQCIFDPYFDDKAIAALGILVNLGLKLIPEVQILITSKAKNRISLEVITDFEIEHGSKLNIRVCTSDK
jgi:hypothetical protein